MTDEQKAFIRNELIPFILREQGNGFAMDTWLWQEITEQSIKLDGIERPAPACSTACCIGGSVQFLKKLQRQYGDECVDYQIAEILGLTHAKADILMYQWEDEWPEPFRTDFQEGKTPLAKAQVACALLEEICRTNGKCMDEL